MPVRGAADHSHDPSVAAAPPGEALRLIPVAIDREHAGGADDASERLDAAFGPSLAPPPRVRWPSSGGADLAAPVPPAGTDAVRSALGARP